MKRIPDTSAALIALTILAAALYDPVFTSAITDPATFALAVACFVLLVVAKAPPWSVVLLGAVAGILLAVF